jgi:hypothetical protein
MLWSQYDADLSQFLADANESSFPAAFRIIAFNRAMEHFAEVHTAPVSATAIAATATAAGNTIPLPSNMVTLAGVLTDGSWLLPNKFRPGGSFPTEGYIDMGDSVYLCQDVDDEAELWYYRFYNKIVDDNSVLEVPRWAEWPLMNLTMALLLAPDMIKQAKLRQFQSTRESGQPEDNPPRRQAEYFLAQYREALASIQPQLRILFK